MGTGNAPLGRVRDRRLASSEAKQGHAYTTRRACKCYHVTALIRAPALAFAFAPAFAFAKAGPSAPAPEQVY